jgi:hypothetical protein
VSKGFTGFDVREFAKISKETGKGKVKIDGKAFTLNELQWFLYYDATIIIGKHWVFTGGKWKLDGLNAFEVAELIRKNPLHVVVVGDYYQAHENAEFIRLGAKVILLYCCTQDNCDIEAYLNKTPPPKKDVLSQDNFRGTAPAIRGKDYYHKPIPWPYGPPTNIID